jgi:hypothetical protein
MGLLRERPAGIGAIMIDALSRTRAARPPLSAPGQEAMTMSAQACDGVPLEVWRTPVPGPALANVADLPERAGLYAPVDGAFQRIAKMAANVFSAPIATVSIIGDDRVWFPAAEGLAGMTEAPLDPAVFAQMWADCAPRVVEDAANDPRTKDHPVVRGSFGVRFYVAAAIVSADGQVLGALEAMDSRRRRRVSESALALLGDLAATAAQLLQIRMSALSALRAEQESRAVEADEREFALQQAVQRSQIEQARLRPERCQLGGSDGCSAPAELKMADTWGDSAWGCWLHAEEALVQVPSVFLASEAPVGLMAYRARASRAGGTGGTISSP